jgi:hypothetical protein
MIRLPCAGTDLEGCSCLPPGPQREYDAVRTFRLCRLVAHHSCAINEAGEHGFADVLSSEFDPAPDVLASVLTCCDMTTSPDGQPVPVERRLAETHDRYGSDHLVSRSIKRATPTLSAKLS